MSPTGNRRRFVRPALAAGALLTTVTGIVVSAVIPRRTERVPVTALSLLASRDLGRLPARGTSAGQWCGAIGSLSAPAHCYELQEASGDLTDETGGLTLTAAGTPRYAVPSGLPIAAADGTVDFTTEDAIYSDGSGRFGASGETPPAAISISFVFNSTSAGSNQSLFDWGYTSGAGVNAILLTGGTIRFRADYGSAHVATTSASYDDGAWHCVTVAFNGTGTAAWVDGVDQSLSMADYGSTTGSSAVAIMSTSVSSLVMIGGMARYRVDHAVATAADHAAICGTLWQPLRADHAAYADATWTQTGGARCFASGDHTAVCIPGGMAGYAYDASLAAAGYSGYGWAVEPGRINGLLYSTAVDCTNWVCVGSPTITTGVVAPDGSATASTVTVTTYGADHIGTTTPSIYTANATVYPRLWVKCSTGTLEVRRNSTSYGYFDVDCSSIAGAWTVVYPGHPAVTPGSDFVANGTGASNLFLTAASGTVTASVWAPTLTETPGLSVIPTSAAAVDTGDPVYSIANSGTYWATGDTVTNILDEIAGTCIVPGNPTFLLSGSSTCTSVIRSVEVTR